MSKEKPFTGEKAFLDDLAQKLTVINGRALNLQRQSSILIKTLLETTELFEDRRKIVYKKKNKKP